MMTSPVLFLSTVMTLLSASLGTGSLAAASDRTYEVRLLLPVSGDSPFPVGCPGEIGDADRLPGSEIEPMIAVNPEDPANIVATWQQDLGAAARADLVAATHDRGRTWKSVTMGGTACTGGPADAASDPWVSAGPRDTMYFGGSLAFLAVDPPRVRVVASRSSTGGISWSPVRAVSGTTHRNDKPNIAADPFRAGRAYMTWGNRDIPPEVPSKSVQRFARTSDGARTWSKPVVADRAPPDSIDISGEVVPLPDGDLLTLIARVKVNADNSFESQLFSTRSRDHGRTWSPATLVTSHPLPEAVVDPESGQELDSQDLSIHSAAVARDGTVYVAWDSSVSLNDGGVDVIVSRDAGRHWTPPRAIPGVTRFAMEPAIAAGPSGSVGVLWYDMRRDRPGDGVLTTDVRFAHSADHGFTWQQLRVAGPFDQRTAPLHRLGEYQGLAATGRRGFAAIFTQSAPQARRGASDVFYALIAPRRY
jgi:hypothetical protein